ncbi:MAG: citrate synthase [Proteobacteria bacterium]|nr:citrate synthase [Pseudomonadota bacterium]
MSEIAELKLAGQTIELPVIVGSENEKGIDVSSLRGKTGYITLDNGYMNTGACSSAITFIDGEKGILRYRGIPIEVLAERSSFLETSYLLIEGKLPTREELDSFTNRVRRHTMIHEDIKRFYDGFPRDAHPMAILASVVSSLSTFYQHEESRPEAEKFALNSIRLLAKLPTIAASAYKKSIGQPLMYPQNHMSYCENFLHMMFSTPAEHYDVDPVMTETLNLLLILHADHEQNCSTSTVRMVSSSKANIFASITAGICALWGPRHGGANEEVIDMLTQMRDDGGGVKRYIDKAKDKNSTFKLMGFGHRVYKNFDPRANILKAACDKLLTRMKISDPLLDLAKELEEAALKDPYFVERKLYPNVDFYSGIIYKAMGIPTRAFTVMFALGRLPGWIAHAKEYSQEVGNKINRPRQIYTGAQLSEYIPMEQRK